MNQTMVQVNISSVSSVLLMAYRNFASFVLVSLNTTSKIYSESFTLITN